MAGLSWGGFYTLVTAAVDQRIKVALTSCFFNDRYRYNLSPAAWFDSANKFFDSEIAGLVCPRSLCIEAGRHDTLFAVDGARAEAEKVADIYCRLGIEERFNYFEHNGGHEFNRTDECIDFVISRLCQ